MKFSYLHHVRIGCEVDLLNNTMKMQFTAFLKQGVRTFGLCAEDTDFLNSLKDFFKVKKTPDDVSGDILVAHGHKTLFKGCEHWFCLFSSVYASACIWIHDTKEK